MPPAYEILLLNTAIPQIQAAQAGDTYVVPRDIAFSTVASLAAGTEALPSLVATGDVNTGFWFPAADTIAASTGGTRRLTIDSSGNLGIGTNAPANKLSINQGSSSTAGLLISGSSSPQLVITETSTPVTAQYATDAAAAYLGTTTNHSLILRTNNTECARITSGGYFKASNTGTYAGSTGTYHELRSNANETSVIVQNTSATLTQSVNGIQVNYSGASPNSTSASFLYCNDSAALRAEIRSNGGLANYQANDVNLSDARLKTDIAPVASYWDKIKSLEIVSFKYKDQTDDIANIGVIAQQVESVAPEFVSNEGFGTAPEGGSLYKTIYTTDMYHAAIKALQEAMARIETLEAKIAAFEQGV